MTKMPQNGTRLYEEDQPLYDMNTRLRLNWCINFQSNSAHLYPPYNTNITVNATANIIPINPRQFDTMLTLVTTRPTIVALIPHRKKIENEMAS